MSPALRFQPIRHRDPAASGGTLISRLVAGNIVVAGLLIALGWLALQSSHRAYADKAQDATESLAVSLRQGIAAEIRRVDMGLVMARSALARSAGDVGTIQSVLDEQLALLPLADSLRVIDTEGIVRLGRGVVPGSRVDLSDRDYFRRAKAARGDELIISEPLEARISKKWVVVLARRLVKPDGSFGGVVYANLSADAFVRRFEEVDVGQYGAITLRSATRQLIARRSPGSAGPPAYGSTQVSKELDDALRAGPTAGFFIAATALDGIERMSAFRSIDDYPLLVLVGLSTREYFAPWRKLAWQVAALLGLAISTLVAVSVFVARSYGRERQAAQDLTLEGLRSRALLRSASDGVQILDRQGRVHEASDSMAALLGRRREDLLGRHVSEWDTQMSDDELSAWLTTLPLGEHRRFETTYRRNDGESVAVEVYAVVVQIGNDEWVHCSVRDITDRNRLLSELTQARDVGDDLYENAPCAYFSEDARGRFLRVNAKAADWLGVDQQVLVGHSGLADFLSDRSRDRLTQAMGPLLTGQPIGPLSLDLVNRQDQSVRRVRLTATAVLDRNGRFLSSRAVAHDITDIHRLSLEHERLSREQSAMLEQALVAVLRVKGSCAVWTNPAAERIFGYSRSEFIGMSSAHFYADEATRERTGQEARAAIAAGRTFRAQVKMLRKDGSEIWVDMSIASLTGTTDEVLIMMADISDIKHAERLRIEATTLEAQNAVLLETARQKDLFLANMSHELRTPLNAVIGFSELMRRTASDMDPQKLTRYATQIIASGKDLLELIDGMLDTAWLDAQKIDFHPESIDVQAALDEVREMLAAKCEARKVSIEPPKVDPSVREVYLDSLRLRQVMLNLIGNAVKFSRDGGTVRLRVMPALPGSFCLEVQDDGIGIAESDLQTLFVPFRQLSTGNNKTHAGTGLGLALVRRLLEAQGGTIALTSTLGVGTIVRVTLPRSMAPSMPDRLRGTPEPQH